MRYLILVVVLVGALSLVVWLSRRSATPIPAGGSTPAAAANAAGGALPASPRDAALGAAFRDGKLPAPMPLPEGDPDVQAAALAGAIAAGDEHSTAALVQALAAAGYGIRREDGSLLAAPGAQGMAFPEWQVAAIAKLFGRRHAVRLGTLAAGLERSFPALKDVPVADDLLAGIRASAKSTNASTRFWARLVVELGMASYVRTNLADESIAASDVRLDAIQTSLVLMRLAGDLGTVERRHQPAAARTQDLLEIIGLRPVPVYAATLAPPGDDGPCTTTTNEGIILDYAAIGLTTAFGQLAGELESHFSLLKPYGKGASYANILLTLTKFLATYASANAEITMDGSLLTRTQTLSPGERHQLTAHLFVDPGKYASAANCVRTALNLAGIDFSLPGKGDLGGVKAIWSLVEDEDTGGLDALLHNARLDEDETADNTKDSDPVGGVYLQARPNGSPLTTANGTTSITVVGAPQDEDLSAQHPLKVERKVRVAVFMQVKPTEAPADPAAAAQMGAGTLSDFLGPLVAAVTGDRYGALTGLATESLYRTAWFASDSFPFTVKDWRPCGNDWTGTVESMTIAHDERPGEVFDLGKSLAVTNGRSIVRATLVGNAGTATVDRSEIGVKTVTGQQFCGTNAHPQYAPYNARDTMTTIGRGSGKVTLYVSIDKAAGTYSIEVTPEFDYDVTMTARPSLQNACPGFQRKEQEQAYPSKSRAEIRVPKQPLDPKSPDALTGTTTVGLEGTGTWTTYKWDLKRCSLSTMPGPG